MQTVIGHHTVHHVAHSVHFDSLFYMTCTLVVKLILPTGCFVSRSSCHTMARVSPETFNMGQLIFWQAKKWVWFCLMLTGVLRPSKVQISDFLQYLQLSSLSNQLGAGHTAILSQLCVWLAIAFCLCQTQAMFGTHACLVLAAMCPAQWVSVSMTVRVTDVVQEIHSSTNVHRSQTV